jgi:hypothetical protein
LKQPIWPSWAAAWGEFFHCCTRELFSFRWQLMHLTFSSWIKRLVTSLDALVVARADPATSRIRQVSQSADFHRFIRFLL